MRHPLHSERGVSFSIFFFFFYGEDGVIATLCPQAIHRYTSAVCASHSIRRQQGVSITFRGVCFAPGKSRRTAHSKVALWMAPGSGTNAPCRIRPSRGTSARYHRAPTSRPPDVNLIHPISLSVSRLRQNTGLIVANIAPICQSYKQPSPYKDWSGGTWDVCISCMRQNRLMVSTELFRTSASYLSSIHPYSVHTYIYAVHAQSGSCNH